MYGAPGIRYSGRVSSPAFTFFRKARCVTTMPAHVPAMPMPERFMTISNASPGSTTLSATPIRPSAAVMMMPP